MATARKQIGLPPPRTIFGKYPPGKWTVAGVTHAFPVVSIQEDGGNRIIERKRPYRDGAKLDDTGSEPKKWVLEVLFNNTITEEGVDSLNSRDALYPTVLNKMIASFDTHETGDLVVPTVGKRRARAQSYSRRETTGEQEASLVSFTFIEDNEDNVSAASIQAPSANANASRLADVTTFDAQSAGAWDDNHITLGQLSTQLESLANGPGDVIADLETQSRVIRGTARAARRVFEAPSKAGRRLYNDPDNSRGPRKLHQQEDLAARAAHESRRGRPQLITIVFREDTSIFQVSSQFGQSVDDLMEVNPGIDPFFIPSNTPVRVFATEAFLNASAATG